MKRAGSAPETAIRVAKVTGKLVVIGIVLALIGGILTLKSCVC